MGIARSRAAPDAGSPSESRTIASVFVKYPRSEPLSADEDDIDSVFGVHKVCAAVNVAAHEIRPRLFLGSLVAAMDPDEIHARRITHVVNCLQPGNAPFAKVLPPPDAAFASKDYSPPAALTVLTLDLDDVPAQDVLTVIPQAADFIDAALAASDTNRVLVHCAAGVSRSATLLAATLMRRERLTAARAVAELQMVRCCVNPNKGFRRQLLAWEETVRALHAPSAPAGKPALKTALDL